MPQLKTSKEILDKKYKNFFSWRQFMGLARSFRSLHAFETESYAFLLFFKSCIALYIFSFDFQFFYCFIIPPSSFQMITLQFLTKNIFADFFPLHSFHSSGSASKRQKTKKVGYSSKTTQLTKYEHKKDYLKNFII